MRAERGLHIRGIPPAKAGGFSDAPEGAQSAQGPTGTPTRGLRFRGLSDRQRTDGWKKEATRCAPDYSDTRSSLSTDLGPPEDGVFTDPRGGL